MVAAICHPADSLFSQLVEPLPEAAGTQPEQFDQEPAGRQRVIELILQTNRSATHHWLDRFDDAALREYLLHLQASQRPRGRSAIWLRTAQVPAITMADAPE
jgi:hypothetical protein